MINSGQGNLQAAIANSFCNLLFSREPLRWFPDHAHSDVAQSDTPRGAGGLVSRAASKAVVPLVEASR